MAKGIEINGQMRGKRGGVVYYRAAGQQISRARNFAPSNPKTAKQAVQRMVLATASKMAAALRPIVNHSWEGVSAGDMSVRHFQSQAMRYLRDVAAVYLDGGSSGIETASAFALKGAPIAGAVAGLQLSSGRLSFPVYSMNDGILELLGGLPSSLGSSSEYVAWLSSLGMMPGDQLTIVGYFQQPAVHAADYGDEYNPVDAYRFARVVFRPAADVDFAEPVSVLVDGKFNSVLIEQTQGEMPSISLSEGGNYIQFDMASVMGGWEPCGAAIIISRKTEDGKFQYNTARLVSDVQYWDSNNAYPVYLSYMAGTTPVNVGDVRYLQHAVAAPFPDGGGVSGFPFNLSVQSASLVLGAPFDTQIISEGVEDTRLIVAGASPGQLSGLRVEVNGSAIQAEAEGIYILGSAGVAATYDVVVSYQGVSWSFALLVEAEP